MAWEAWMRRSLCVAAGALCIALAPGSATAHGDLHGTDPDPGATLRKAPGTVSVTLTEAPGPGSTLKVADGCTKDAGEEPSIKGSELVSRVPAGQPGDWVLRYRAVSSVDGHVTNGSIHFTVRGRKDCSERAPEGTVELGGGEDTQVANPDPPDEGGGFPIVSMAIGTIVLVGLAMVLRRASAR